MKNNLIKIYKSFFIQIFIYKFTNKIYKKYKEMREVSMLSTSYKDANTIAYFVQLSYAFKNKFLFIDNSSFDIDEENVVKASRLLFNIEIKLKKVDNRRKGYLVILN